MIYIDTNALYYAVGISTHKDVDIEKLKELISSQETAISSTSVYEFIMKYRNDIDVIHDLGRFMANNNIKIAFNKYFKQTENFTPYIGDISEEKLDRLVNEIKDIKIYTESRFAAIIFCMRFFSGLYFKCVKNSTVSSFAEEISRIAMNFIASIMPEVFQNYFEDGYSTDDCEKYIKNKFSQLLEIFFQSLIPFIEKAADAEGEISVKDFLDEHNWEEISKVLGRKIRRESSSTIYLKKIANQYWKEENDDHLMDFFKKFSNTYNKFPEKALREYANEIMYKCCIEGGTFWKNSILDAIILCHVDEENELITFDNGVILHMKKYEKERCEYTTSLSIIESLYL